ncbi:hypothetical protein H6F91_06715 [Leptolyngbya sp. FACHB-8]|nr:hypothetical protein [Leptolyngbya sp. FACHB-8]
MEDVNLNKDLESLKRTVDESKSLLKWHCTLFLDTLVRIEEIGRTAHATKERTSTAVDKLRENSDDVAARQALEECQALVDPLRESLSQYIAECSHQVLEISTATNAIKVAERLIIKFSADPGTTCF